MGSTLHPPSATERGCAPQSPRPGTSGPGDPLPDLTPAPQGQVPGTAGTFSGCVTVASACTVLPQGPSHLHPRAPGPWTAGRGSGKGLWEGLWAFPCSHISGRKPAAADVPGPALGGGCRLGLGALSVGTRGSRQAPQRPELCLTPEPLSSAAGPGPSPCPLSQPGSANPTVLSPEPGGRVAQTALPSSWAQVSWRWKHTFKGPWHIRGAPRGVHPCSSSPGPSGWWCGLHSTWGQTRLREEDMPRLVAGIGEVKGCCPQGAGSRPSRLPVLCTWRLGRWPWVLQMP